METNINEVGRSRYSLRGWRVSRIGSLQLLHHFCLLVVQQQVISKSDNRTLKYIQFSYPAGYQVGYRQTVDQNCFRIDGNNQELKNFFESRNSTATFRVRASSDQTSLDCIQIGLWCIFYHFAKRNFGICEPGRFTQLS